MTNQNIAYLTNAGFSLIREGVWGGNPHSQTEEVWESGTTWKAKAFRGNIGEGKTPHAAIMDSFYRTDYRLGEAP